jgi:hypothetical protein
MKTKHFLQLLSMAAFCLLLTSCFDSKVPLSDPGKSNADQRLAGIWRLRNDDGSVTYYHIGRVRGRLPASVMRMAWILHKTDGTMQQLDELLVFPTTIGDKTYLNVTDGKDEQMKLLEEKGWTADTVSDYYIFRYQVKGDVLTVQAMDAKAKKRAIESGKVKGLIKKGKFTKVLFTDTSENLAKFVAEAGDDLFSGKVNQFERVK